MPSPSPLDRATPAAPLPEPHLRARPAAPVRPEPAFGTCALAATAVALLAAVVFVPRMGGAFVADSYQIVGLLDVLLREGNLWSEVLASDAYRVTLQPFYRPVAMLALAADYRLFGLDPLSFRLVNLAVHVVAALLFGRVAWRVSGVPAVGLLSAALFVVSPLSAEAVFWAATRGTLLAAAFGAGAVLAAVEATRRRSAGAGRGGVLGLVGAACLALALLSQETAVAFVPVLTAVTFVVAGERGAGAAVRAFVRTAWAWLLVLAYFAWRGYLLGRWVGGYGAGAADPRSAGFWMQRGEQLLTALSPVHLGVFPVAVKAVCLGFVAAALILACVRGARSGAGRRWLAVAAAWFVCFVFPGLFLTVDGAELTNGRLLYVQSAGTAGLVACGIAAIGSRWGRRVAAAAGIALYAVLLAGNLRPWREAAAQADELHAQIEGIARAVPPDRDVVVADLPFVQRGAFVATGAIALPPFLVVPRTTPVLAFLASEHELTLHALAARSGEVAVWRFDPGANELEPQHLALPRPLALAGGGSVLAARSRWQDASSLSVDALIAAGTEDGLVVRVTDGEGHELDRAALAALPGSAGAVRRAVLRVPGPRPAVLRTEIADGGGWRLVDEVRAPRRQ